MNRAFFERGASTAPARQLATAVQTRRAFSEAIQRASERAAGALLDIQKPEGYWCGELLADTTLESDYILLQLWLHPPHDSGWQPPTWQRIQKAARSILSRQLPNGGFNIYPGGPADPSASVKAYTALKLAGYPPDCDVMSRARKAILEMGGIQAVNSYVKVNLSFFGLYPRRHVPTVPPELVLLPGGILYEMSSWTRTIVVPLSIVQAEGGIRPVPAGFNLDELAMPGKSFRLPKGDRISIVFHKLDSAFKIWEHRAPEEIRLRALREAEKWMLDRTRYSEGLGAIYPSMMYLIMALDSLGYPPDHPDRVEAIVRFESLMTESADSLHFQPCFSPVWDTAIAMYALGELGGTDPDAMRRAADWLIEREVRHRGDWSVKRPRLEPSGWAFEYANEHYPDIDDTAMVLLALMHARATRPEAQEACERRAIHWLVNMQSNDGGWAAFDVDNNWAILNRVPFADHNAMLDPTCPDITGRVVEALCKRGWTAEDDPIRLAIEYLLRNQEKNGSWYGRWGVNYIYGTFLALRGLRSTGFAGAADAARRATQWISTVQNSDGGWGETCASYKHDRFVPGPSKPSQTAWGILGQLASPRPDLQSVQRGLRYLINTQNEDGTWDEDTATGTGFPNVFYLRYTLYRNYFPLLALNTARRAIEAG